MNIIEFRKKYGTRNKCLKHLLDLRMSDDGLCFNPKCTAPIKDFYTQMRKRKAFLCRRCLKHIYPMAGSIFDHSHVDIEIWYEIIDRFIRKGISSRQIHEDYGISYPTIFKIMHVIRREMQKAIEFKFSGTVVEIDETYNKTGTKGLGRHHKFSVGRGSDRTTSLLTIIERGPKGWARMFVIPATDADSIIPIILENVDTDTVIFTDSWGAYNDLKNLGYNHAVVNHSLEFVNYENSASTNTAENLHSNFKRMVRTTYRSISHEYCQSYANEHCFRHCFRHEEDFGFKKLMSICLPPLSDYYKSTSIAA